MTTATTLHLMLLGGFRAVIEDTTAHPPRSEPVTDFASTKTQALLAYLACTRQRHSRDALAAMFWGETDDEAAKTSLRQSLANLKKLVGSNLLIERDAIEFDARSLHSLDVHDFARDAHGDVDAQRDALALYKGDLLKGLAVKNAPEFEEWLVVERERLRQLAINTLRHLATADARAGDAPAAIANLHALVALDPLDEPAHRQLMLLLARNGQRAAALTQFEACKRALDKELGVPPDGETVHLYERIRSAQHRTHLPQTATPFMGRADELATIAALLTDATCRLITLIGPGGCGKTRLALEAAARSANRFLHGVYFVSLVGASSMSIVPSAIADALGVALSGKADTSDQLLAYLADKELLLVLDNLEHLAGADEWVGQLAQAGPSVRLLVTSRERLNLYGEQLIEVGGLEAPPVASDVPIAGYSAVQLFLSSAREVAPTFALDADAERAVVRICQLVNGLPLALELAAAWVRQMTCHEIADEIERSLSFLATAQKNVPTRHRSLQAAFEHSWALLSDDERSVFARLAVFRGGGERAAALAIAQCPLSILAALCDKSLLYRNPAGRYALHELLRQYAEGKLQAEPQELDLTQTRHCAYFVEFLSAREDALNDARQNEARREIAAEMDNVRAAWGWAVTRNQIRALMPALEGLRLFFEHMGWYSEAIALFAAAAEAERASASDNPLVGSLLARQAWFHHRRDQFDAAHPLIEHSLKILRAAQPPLPAEEALCLQCLANMARAVGDFDLAIEYSRQSLALYRIVGNPRPIAASLNSLAVAHAECGQLEDAQRLHEECLEIRRAMGDRRGVATVLVNLAFAALAKEDYEDVKPLAREALDIFREIGYPMGEAVALNNLGVACHMLGEYDEAHSLLNECLTLSQELGHRHIAAHALSSLAGVAGARGEHALAWQLMREALLTARAIGSISATLFGLVSAARLMAEQRQWERAAEIAAFVFNHAAANHETKNRAGHLLDELQVRLPAAILATKIERGQVISLDDAVAGILASEVMHAAATPAKLS
jgi:predicted ATPase/DNA-binding SARP family transcriptional activator